MAQHLPTNMELAEIFRQFQCEKTDATEKQERFRNLHPIGECATLDACQVLGRADVSDVVRQYIREGKVAVVILAGGMGSRLGVMSPKGTFPVTPVTGKSLFQVLIEKICVLRKHYNAPIRTYIMTNPMSHELSQVFLREHNFFGLPEEDVFFFSQGEMPAINPVDGSLYYLDDGKIYCGPDGHGGLITALRNTSAGEDMRRHGIRTINTFHIDNPLVPILNEQMLALHLHQKSDMTSVAVEKIDGMELVGNIVRNSDGKICVVEYMDFPGELAMKTDSAGGLRFWAGSIGIHLIELDFLEEMERKIREDAKFLPYHLPLKKIHTQNGRVEWGIKPERFIFDILPFANNPAVIRVTDRDEVFATLKQSAEPVRNHLSDLHASWLKRIGATFPASARVEIAPSFALDFATLRERLPSGMTLDDSLIYLE